MKMLLIWPMPCGTVLRSLHFKQNYVENLLAGDITISKETHHLSFKELMNMNFTRIEMFILQLLWLHGCFTNNNF